MSTAVNVCFRGRGHTCWQHRTCIQALALSTFCISLLTSSKLLMFNKNVSLPQCLKKVLKKVMFFIVQLNEPLYSGHLSLARVEAGCHGRGRGLGIKGETNFWVKRVKLFKFWKCILYCTCKIEAFQGVEMTGNMAPKTGNSHLRNHQH